MCICSWTGFCSCGARPFGAHLMPIAVGMYLPFGLSVPILVGGIVAFLLTAGTTEQTRPVQPGVLLASGAIAGEALMGSGWPCWPASGSRLSLGLPDGLVTLLTFGAVVFTLVSFIGGRGPQGLRIYEKCIPHRQITAKNDDEVVR